MSTTPTTHQPRIDPSIPRDVQRHLQLIYNTLNNHATAFQALPKSTGTNPVTATALSPRISATVPHEVSRHLQLIYDTLNNHAAAFAQLPKLSTAGTASATNTTSTTQTFAAKIEPSIPFEVQTHLQLIYGKLANHSNAFEFYKANMPATTTAG